MISPLQPSESSRKDYILEQYRTSGLYSSIFKKNKNMAKYKLRDPESVNDFESLAIISYNLRYYSKIWKEYYGSANRKEMGIWEEKLDKWIEKNIQPESDIPSDATPINNNTSWYAHHTKLK